MQSKSEQRPRQGAAAKRRHENGSAADNAPGAGERQDGSGQIVAGNFPGLLFLHWCCDRNLLKQFLEGKPATDDCLGISAPGLRLEVSFHDGTQAAETAARSLRDRARFRLQSVEGEA